LAIPFLLVFFLAWFVPVVYSQEGTPTPDPILQEVVASPDGDYYLIQHNISWGDIGIVACLLLQAGLEILNLFSKVPSWLRH